MSEMPVRAKIYLAGPFFNPEQVSNQERVEKMCEKARQPFFSPRLELVLKPDATPGERTKVFQSNVRHVRSCRLVLANIEGLDAGTIWEMGAAYAYGTKVVAYSPNESRRLNVMLAESCEGYLAGLWSVEQFLNGSGSYKIMGGVELRSFNKGALQTWNRNVY